VLSAADPDNTANDYLNVIVIRVDLAGRDINNLAVEWEEERVEWSEFSGFESKRLVAGQSELRAHGTVFDRARSAEGAALVAIIMRDDRPYAAWVLLCFADSPLQASDEAICEALERAFRIEPN
jgi:hypothetical protein